MDCSVGVDAEEFSCFLVVDGLSPRTLSADVLVVHTEEGEVVSAPLSMVDGD